MLTTVAARGTLYFFACWNTNPRDFIYLVRPPVLNRLQHHLCPPHLASDHCRDQL